MLPANLKCVKCGQPPGCRCWLKLECPRCGKARMAERYPIDPEAAVRIVFPCADDMKDGDEVVYYDAAGNRIGV